MNARDILITGGSFVHSHVGPSMNARNILIKGGNFVSVSRRLYKYFGKHVLLARLAFSLSILVRRSLDLKDQIPAHSLLDGEMYLTSLKFFFIVLLVIWS